MELAKVTSKGQITIPVEIRTKLRLKPGDKVLFVEEDGVITMQNSSEVALTKIQSAMSGQAAETGIETERDVMAVVEEIRSTR